MTELKHWLDEASEADEFERAILRSGLDADPPDAKRDQIWTDLMGTLAIAPLAAASTSARAATAKAAAGANTVTAVFTAISKGFLVGLAIYGASAGMSEISNRLSAPHARALPAQHALTSARAPSGGSQPPVAASAPAITHRSDTAPSTPRAAQRGSVNGNASPLAQEPADLGAELPSIATFDDSEQPRSARLSQLEAETRALRRARDQLRVGKLSDAFGTLEASRRQFSAPELYQEREALMIELLSRSGQVTAAEQRAHAFLSRFPESPHVQQIRRFAEH